MTLAGARQLAAAMMGMDAPEEPTRELSELELSAVAEAMNQMMAVGRERDHRGARHRGRDRAAGDADASPPPPSAVDAFERTAARASARRSPSAASRAGSSSSSRTRSSCA